MNWYRHTSAKGYQYDFQSTDFETAIEYAKWKFNPGGVVTPL